MSLTSEIKDLQSPTVLYFRNNFPDKEKFKQEWKKRVKNLPSILPQDPIFSNHWSLVGHAIDYRIRLFYKKYHTINTVACNGRGAIKRKARIWESLSELFDDLSVDIAGKMPSYERERQIALCCIVLSYYEIQFRAGEPNKLILQANTLEDLFSGIPEIVIDDLIQLFHAFFESDKPSSNNIVLNPTFVGSGDVGGADGDIIIDHVLWDLKSTKNPNQFKNLFWPYQLIGYALLDYNNRYALKECGIYLVRQACWISWSFEELFALLGSDPEIDISAHRKRFINSLKEPPLSESPPRVPQEWIASEEKEDLMQQIRDLRTLHGLTLRGMADRLHVPEKEWKRIFNGNLRSSSSKTLKEYIERMKSWSKEGAI